jgi:2-oxoglutarate ferredoxin oxidoreductase subunit gamma
MHNTTTSMLRLILAGFGGQGVLFMGKVLAQAGMISGRHVSWIPSYGPEMRGGTANCSVVISDKKIGSPTVAKPDLAIVMNTASYERFVDVVVPGGILYVNSSIVVESPNCPAREDIRIVRIPVNQMAHKLGNDQVANIIMLGAMQGVSPVVSPDAFAEAMKQLTGKKPELAELNARALRAGEEFVQNL